MNHSRRVAVLCGVSSLTYAALLTLSAREGKPEDEYAAQVLADGTGTSHCEGCGSPLDAEGVCTSPSSHKPEETYHGE